MDNSFFDAVNEPPSPDQMSIVGDPAYLFNGYYNSEVLRSGEQFTIGAYTADIYQLRVISVHGTMVSRLVKD